MTLHQVLLGSWCLLIVTEFNLVFLVSRLPLSRFTCSLPSMPWLFHRQNNTSVFQPGGEIPTTLQKRAKLQTLIACQYLRGINVRYKAAHEPNTHTVLLFIRSKCLKTFFKGTCTFYKFTIFQNVTLVEEGYLLLIKQHNWCLHEYFSSTACISTVGRGCSITSFYSQQTKLQKGNVLHLSVILFTGACTPPGQTSPRQTPPGRHPPPPPPRRTERIPMHSCFVFVCFVFVCFSSAKT